jgi:hypothetical protein
MTEENQEIPLSEGLTTEGVLALIENLEVRVAEGFVAMAESMMTQLQDQGNAAQESFAAARLELAALLPFEEAQALREDLAREEAVLGAMADAYVDE